MPALVGKVFTRAQENENASAVANGHTLFEAVSSQTLAPLLDVTIFNVLLGGSIKTA